MLVLSRLVGQKIVIGDGIEITVVDIDRNKVRIGITADKSVPIHRAEVLEPKKRSPPSVGQPTPLPFKVEKPEESEK